eukprot:COSAG03_NODE_522_length_7202_cov_16.938336_5_plen_216_part_00
MPAGIAHACRSLPCGGAAGFLCLGQNPVAEPSATLRRARNPQLVPLYHHLLICSGIPVPATDLQFSTLISRSLGATTRLHEPHTHGEPVSHSHTHARGANLLLRRIEVLRGDGGATWSARYSCRVSVCVAAVRVRLARGSPAGRDVGSLLALPGTTSGARGHVSPNRASRPGKLGLSVLAIYRAGSECGGSAWERLRSVLGRWRPGHWRQNQQAS